MTIKIEELNPKSFLFRDVIDESDEWSEFTLSGVIEPQDGYAVIKGLEGKDFSARTFRELKIKVRAMGFSYFRYFRLGRRTGPGLVIERTPRGRWFEVDLTRGKK